MRATVLLFQVRPSSRPGGVHYTYRLTADAGRLVPVASVHGDAERTRKARAALVAAHARALLAELFPDIRCIRDDALRDKVAAVWSEALTSGCGGKGWTFDEIRAIPFTLPARGHAAVRDLAHLRPLLGPSIGASQRLGMALQRARAMYHDGDFARVVAGRIAGNL